MSMHINSLTKYFKAIAKHYKGISFIGIIVFLPNLIKLLIKGISNIDKMDLFVDIIIYAIFLTLVTLIRKKYKD